MDFLPLRMIRFPRALLLLFLGMMSHTASAQWEWLHPTPHGNWMYGLDFVGDHGWAVGGTGITKTTDRGESWALTDLGGCTSLLATDFVDTLDGWAVGIGGAIVATRDGGRSWERQDAGTRTRLEKVAFADSLHGWILGGTSLLLRTVDGGRSWDSIPSPSGGDVQSLAVTGAGEVWVGSDGRGLFHSTDRGGSWERIHDSTYRGPHALYFLDNLTGWAAYSQVDTDLYSNRFLKSTTDGGKTWSIRLVNKNYSAIQKIHFVDPDHGILTTNKTIDRTVDGGRSWAQASILASNLFIGEARLIGADSGWIVGSDGQMLRSSDAGTTWKAPGAVFSSERQMTAAHFFDELHGVASGRNSFFYTTSDAGVTWRESKAATGSHVRQMLFIDKRFGWTVGSSGAVHRSTDGGASWFKSHIPQISQGRADLNQVDFTDSLHGWTIGNSYEQRCYLFKTTNGAGSWESVDSGRGTMYDVDFLDSLHGYLLKQTMYDASRVLMRTSDGGTTWDSTTIVSADGETVVRMAMIDIDNGFAVGTGGTILRTSDRWQTWTTLDRVSSVDLSEIYFLDDRHGWIGGNCGTILRTSDGGTTWDREKLPSGYPVENIVFASPTRGWAFANGLLATGLDRPASLVPEPVDGDSRKSSLSRSISIRGNEIVLDLERAAVIGFTLVDMQGRLLEEIPRQYHQAGMFVSFSGVEQMPNGVYIYRIDIDGEVMSGKIVLRR